MSVGGTHAFLPTRKVVVSKSKYEVMQVNKMIKENTVHGARDRSGVGASKYSWQARTSGLSGLVVSCAGHVKQTAVSDSLSSGLAHACE